MSPFERKFGKYAIKNISLVLILCYACGYVIQFINQGFLNYLTLNPYAILHGQIWRLVTWIIVPPDTGNIFFTLIMLYFYYSIGTTLEHTWGTYRYNLYLFTGMLFTVLGSFALMGYSYLFQGEVIAYYGPQMFFSLAALFFSTYYVNMSIFLAFSATCTGFADVYHSYQGKGAGNYLCSDAGGTDFHRKCVFPVCHYCLSFEFRGIFPEQPQ